jgi:hypothetical protein
MFDSFRLNRNFRFELCLRLKTYASRLVNSSSTLKLKSLWPLLGGIGDEPDASASIARKRPADDGIGPNSTDSSISSAKTMCSWCGNSTGFPVRSAMSSSSWAACRSESGISQLDRSDQHDRSGRAHDDADARSLY